MAINIKIIFADALLKLCRKKKLKSIGVMEIINEAGASRQTFYNHFRDKYDLIQWIYDHEVLGDFAHISPDNDYYELSVEYYRRIAEYREFLRQACEMTGQNSLREHMIQYAIDYDMQWYTQKYQGRPDEFKLAVVRYHAVGTIYFAIDWITGNAYKNYTPEQMAVLATKVRNIRYYDYVFDGKYVNRHSDV